jgi:hypothetical protein
VQRTVHFEMSYSDSVSIYLHPFICITFSISMSRQWL